MVVDETPIRYGALPVTPTIVMWGLVGLAAWWLAHRMHYV